MYNTLGPHHHFNNSIWPYVLYKRCLGTVLETLCESASACECDGERETSLSRFDVLTVVSRESLVPLLVGGILTAAVYRLRKSRIAAIHPRLFLFYLGIALAGSLPI